MVRKGVLSHYQRRQATKNEQRGGAHGFGQMILREPRTSQTVFRPITINPGRRQGTTDLGFNCPTRRKVPPQHGNFPLGVITSPGIKEDRSHVSGKNKDGKFQSQDGGSHGQRIPGINVQSKPVDTKHKSALFEKNPIRKEAGISGSKQGTMGRVDKGLGFKESISRGPVYRPKLYVQNRTNQAGISETQSEPRGPITIHASITSNALETNGGRT